MGKATLIISEYTRDMKGNPKEPEGIDTLELIKIISALPEGTKLLGTEPSDVLYSGVNYKFIVENKMFKENGVIKADWTRNIAFTDKNEIKDFNEFRGLDLSNALAGSDDYAEVKRG